jgi:hypothetical protein
MAEDEYDRRKKMTGMQKLKEDAGSAIKGLFGGGSKATAAPAPKPAAEDTNLSRIRANQAAKNKALKEYKKGGKVSKTGPAKLHKNERVLTVKQTQKLDKKPAVKKAIGLKAKKR